MSLRALLSGACLMALAPLAAAEPVSLQQALEAALQYDPSLDQASAGMERSEAGLDAARAKAGPTAGLQAQIGALETDFTTDRISQVPRQIGLQAEWPVFTSGANAAAIVAARAQREAAAAQLLSAREQTVLNTFDAYARAWLAEQELAVAAEQVETFRLRLQQTEAQFDQGLVTRTDIALTQSRLASAEAQQEGYRAALAAAEARLARLTGLDKPSPAHPVALPGGMPTDFQQSLAHVLETNPDLAAARASEASADKRVQEARSRFGPKVSLKARATTGEDIYFFFEDPISDVGAFVSVEVPLYTSGLKSASTREARAGRSAATAGVRVVEVQLKEAVSSLWGDIEARHLALKAATRAEAAASLAAEGAYKEYDAGARTLVDALDAENAYRDAQIARLRAGVELQLASARLRALSSDLEPSLMP